MAEQRNLSITSTCFQRYMGSGERKAFYDRPGMTKYWRHSIRFDSGLLFMNMIDLIALGGECRWDMLEKVFLDDLRHRARKSRIEHDWDMNHYHP